MQFKPLIAFATAVAVALALAAPAGAAKGVKGLHKDLEFSIGSTCLNGGTASYSWSGFHGVHYAVLDVMAGNGGRTSFNTVKANGSGSMGPFTFSVNNGFTYTATAELQTSQGQVIAGSQIVQTLTATCS